MGSTATAEIERGERFEFGQNWQRYLKILSPERIAEAEQSLCMMLRVSDLSGKSFLDIGSGSGLFSLAARRLGARVVSIDYDPLSVACTKELRQRYLPEDKDGVWSICVASVLDEVYLKSLPKFDIVYSWGVLHHTGDLWRALENASNMVAGRGTLFISLYNDQGGKSRRWRAVKRTYLHSPSAIRFIMCIVSFVCAYWKGVVKGMLRGRPLDPFRQYGRGMSAWRDTVDWLGGYPFEVSKPGDVLEFLRKRGFTLTHLATTNESGCNEFVFETATDTRA